MFEGPFKMFNVMERVSLKHIFYLRGVIDQNNDKFILKVV